MNIQKIVDAIGQKLDDESFYLAAQQYRHSSIEDQANTVRNFRAMKDMILKMVEDSLNEENTIKFNVGSQKFSISQADFITASEKYLGGKQK